VVERARLESVYTPKVYRGFESLPLRGNLINSLLHIVKGFFIIYIYVISASAVAQVTNSL
jgi:hypothetical protein